ncbi:CAP domain-containing protein [Halorarius litoreus]|uniref:CAP domain-containing protein n=1 Tax=Halorarius litoreus TaxID=2962676 RepID=UPI0020CC14E2|nr:CAP domain-containing protein [Halorarius litoreus]
MANKAALIIIAVIAATAMGVGAFVGLELGGGAAVASPTPTPTPEGGSGAATPTATATASATATPPTPTVSPTEFNRTKIELAIQSRVNAEREQRGHQSLRRFGVAVDMARFHSENMAEQGFVSHSASGLTTIDRYKRFEIHDRCRTEDSSGTGIREGDELETLAKVTAGRPVQVDGERQYYRNETAVGNAVVDRWLSEDAARKKLFLGPADEAGIGVVVTDDGGVYATLDLC